jgi:HSP20 family protein
MFEKSTLPIKSETWRAPFNMLDDLRSELEQLWQRTRMSSLTAKDILETDIPKLLTPRMDVFKKENELVVKADLPGMKKEDVHVAIEEGDLILKGERKEEKEVKEDDFYKAECFYGSFYRRLPLNFEVAPDKVNAKFTDGVLEVRLPMPPDEQKPAPKEIAIN